MTLKPSQSLSGCLLQELLLCFFGVAALRYVSNICCCAVEYSTMPDFRCLAWQLTFVTRKHTFMRDKDATSGTTWYTSG